MDMNVNKAPRARKPKVKIFTVDTRKPDAAQKLAMYTPANGFAELASSRPGRKAPVFRYFYQSGKPATITANNNNYGEAANNDNSLNALIGKMANIGVADQGELDDLADMLERKAVMGGRSRKMKRSQRKRKATRKH